MAMLFQHKKTVSVRDKNMLSFRPETLDHIYSVQVRLATGADVLPVQYHIAVKFLHLLPTGHLLQINRSELRIGNAPAADSLVYELAQQCGNALYPLQLVLTRNGRITDIHDHETILERWKKTASYLRNYHTSDIALDYIDRTEATLRNKELLKNLLAQDLFFSVYFSPLYGIELNGSYPQRIDYPVIPFRKPVIFHVKQQLEKDGDESNCVVRHTGSAAIPQQVADVFPGEEHAPGHIDTGTIDAVYELSPPHYKINSAEARWTISFGEESREITIRIALISDNAPSFTIETQSL